MRWNDIDSEVCSVARTLSVVGDRWTLLVLRDCFLGTRRFEEFQKSIGMSRHRLTDRLNKLVENALLEKKQYQNNPPRSEYVLTQKGLDIYPVLVSLTGWGNKWMDDGDGIPLEYHHKGCDHQTQPVLSCDHCGEQLGPRDVRVVPGPGIIEKFKRGERPVYIPKKLVNQYAEKMNISLDDTANKKG